MYISEIELTFAFREVQKSSASSYEKAICSSVVYEKGKIALSSFISFFECSLISMYFKNLSLYSYDICSKSKVVLLSVSFVEIIVFVISKTKNANKRIKNIVNILLAFLCFYFPHFLSQRTMSLLKLFSKKIVLKNCRIN